VPNMRLISPSRVLLPRCPRLLILVRRQGSGIHHLLPHKWQICVPPVQLGISLGNGLVEALSDVAESFEILHRHANVGPHPSRWKMLSWGDCILLCAASMSDRLSLRCPTILTIIVTLTRRASSVFFLVYEAMLLHPFCIKFSFGSCFV